MRPIAELIGEFVNGLARYDVPLKVCPHCYQRPDNLDMHLRFDCPVIRPKPQELPMPDVSTRRCHWDPNQCLMGPPCPDYFAAVKPDDDWP